MSPSLIPTIGLCVVHLFWRHRHADEPLDKDCVLQATEKIRAGGDQVVTVAIVGHKADLCTMVLAANLWTIRDYQTELCRSGLELTSSYVSLTEVSEYAENVPEEMKRARLYPQLPPDGMSSWCFYPMSKRRHPMRNWYRLPYQERERLMYEHGQTGRAFRGRVIQLVTGSTGVDDWEWGVTLFAVSPDDLKQVVYKMRFDEASAEYAEFGPFWVGAVAPLEEIIDRVIG